MSVIKRLGLGCAICLIAFFCLTPTRVSAQPAQSAGASQADHDQTLRELLNDVRHLRLTLERATFTTTRFQMLTERLRAQQAQVDLLSHQLTAARLELAKVRTERGEAEAWIKGLENK